MNLVGYRHQEIRWEQWLGLSLTLVLAAAAGLYLPQHSITTNLVLMTVLALVLVVLPSLANDRQLKWYLFVGLLTFGLGLKGLYVGDIVSNSLLKDLVIYPAQLLFWSLAGILLLRLRRRGIRSPWSLATGWKIFFFLATLAVVTGLWRAIASPGIILTRYFIYLTLIPVLFVTRQLITSWEEVRRASWVLIFTAFYVALFAVLEYYVPALFEPLRATFWSSTPTQVTSGGFVRVVYSIWGNTMASNYLIWLLPLTLFFIVQYPERSSGLRLLGLASVFISLVAVYLSGNRAAWILVVLIIFVYPSLQKQKGWFWLTILTLPAAFKFLPDTIYNHLIYAVLIQPDSAVTTRQRLWQRAWELTLHNPLGNGWGAGFLVHNDFLQIATDVGVPALVLFAWLLLQAFRNLRHVSVKLAGTHLAGFAGALFVSILACLGSMQMHPILEVPPLAVSVWFFYALALRLPQLQEVTPAPTLIGTPRVGQKMPLTNQRYIHAMRQ